MKKILTILFISGLMILSCKKDKEAAEPILDTVWALSYIENVSTKLTFNYPADASKKITIVFPQSGVLDFNGICNTGSADFIIDYYDYDVSLGGLTINNIVLTKVGCPYVEWEDYVTESMSKAFLYKITGSNLAISSTGNFNLHFTKE